MRKLRVGLIGYGVMGRNHARVLGELDGVEIDFIYDSNHENIKDIDKNLLLQNLNDIGNRRLDYCVVATPTVTHADIASALLLKDIPVLIEKPLASSYESSKKLVSIADQRNLIGGVGHIERFNAALIELKTRLEAKQLGEIFQISTRRMGPYPIRINDVGVVRDLATHDIDLTSWLLESDYEMVFSQSRSTRKNENEDLVAVTGKLSNGVIVNHLVNWVSPIKERSIAISGENGTLIANTLSSDLTFFSTGTIGVTRPELAHFIGSEQGEIHTYAFDKPEPLLLEHQAFRDCLLGIDKNIVPLDSGAKTVAVAEAVIESSKSDQAVIIKY